MNNSRESVAQARLWCERYYKVTGTRPRMRPYMCGHFCACCQLCGCQDVTFEINVLEYFFLSCLYAVVIHFKVDAIEYYSEEEASLAVKVDEQRAISLQRPLGIAFITLKTENMAIR